MPTQIYNTASLTFEYGSQKGFVSSNIATTTVQESITISKTSLGDSYSQNSEITFIITINNNNNEEIQNVFITDDLGTYSSKNNIYENLFTPLTYKGPSFLYIAGNFIDDITPILSKNKIEYKITNIPAKSTATIIYKASVNKFAPLTSNSQIVSSIKASALNINNIPKASCVITVRDEADIKIIKNMNPNPVLSGEEITYNFFLYNYGNTPATNITLNDTFSPAPSNISVKLNTDEVSSSDFSYKNNTLIFPSSGASLTITIPAANFIQDNVTGIVSVQPGIVNITAIGKI